MDGLHMPPNPSENILRSTPDNGILYIAGSNKTIVFVSPPLNSEPNNSIPLPVNIISLKAVILAIDCDPNWTNDRKHFAVMNEHFLISIWNLNGCEKVLGHTAHRYSNRKSVLAMCYTSIDQVLSIVGSLCIKFCIKSNTYVKYSLNQKWTICMLKISPYNDNIVAAGTKSGLILLMDTNDFSVLHTLCGHNTEIVSIEWIKFKSSVVTKPLKYMKKKQIGLKTNNIDTKNVTISNSANYDLKVKISNIQNAENLNLNDAEQRMNDNILSDIISNNNLNLEEKSNDINLANNGSNAECLIETLQPIRNAGKLYLNEVEQTLKDNILPEPNSTNNLNLEVKSIDKTTAQSIDINSAHNETIAESLTEKTLNNIISVHNDSNECLGDIQQNFENAEETSEDEQNNSMERPKTFKDDILYDINCIIIEGEQTVKDHNLSEPNYTNKSDIEVKSDNSVNNESINSADNGLNSECLIEVEQTLKDDILIEENSANNFYSKLKSEDIDSADNDSCTECYIETLSNIQNTVKNTFTEAEQILKDDPSSDKNSTSKSNDIDSANNDTIAESHIETLQNIQNEKNIFIDAEENSTHNLHLQKPNNIDSAHNDSIAETLNETLQNIQNAEKTNLIEGDPVLKVDTLSDKFSTNKSNDFDSANNDTTAESHIETLQNIQNEKIIFIDAEENSTNNLHLQKSDDIDSADSGSSAECLYGTILQNIQNDDELYLMENNNLYEEMYANNFNSEEDIDSADCDSNDECRIETLSNIQNTDKFNLNEVDQMLKIDILSEDNVITNNLHLELQPNAIHLASHIETLPNNQNAEEIDLIDADHMLKINNLFETNSINNFNLEVKSDDSVNSDSLNSAESHIEQFSNVENTGKFNLNEVDQMSKDGILSDTISTMKSNLEVVLDDIDSEHENSNDESQVLLPYLEAFFKLEVILEEDDTVECGIESIETLSNISNAEQFNLIKVEQKLKSDKIDSLNIDQNGESNIETLQNINNAEQLSSSLPETNVINNFNVKVNSNDIDSVNNDQNESQIKTLQKNQNGEQLYVNEINQTLQDDELSESDCASNSHLKVISNDIDSNKNYVDCLIGTLPNLNNVNDHNKSLNDAIDNKVDQLPLNVNTTNMEFEEKICIASSSMIDNNIWLWDTSTGIGMERIVLKKKNRSLKKNGKNRCIGNSVCWINNSMLAVLSLLDFGITVINISYIGNNRFTIKIKEIGCDAEFDVGIIQNRSKCNENDFQPPIWTFTYKRDRQLVFGDIDSHHFNITGSYSTMSLTHCSIQESPIDQNKIVIGGNGYKFHIFNIASFTSNYCRMLSYTKEYLTQIGSIIWHPTNKNVLAYSTTEGIVCVIDISKKTYEPHRLTTRCKQFCHISWGHIETINDNNSNSADQTQRIVLFVCWNEKLFYFTEDSNYKKFTIINTNDASTVNVGKHFIAVGSIIGGLSIYTFRLKCFWYMKIGQKLITYCAWSSIAPNRLAVSSQENDIMLFTICADGDNKDIVHVDGKLIGHKFGVNMVKWSNHNKNHLVSCSNDCTVRVWDTDKFVCISLVTYSFVMNFAIFSPNDGNFVLATGNSETMHIFDIRNHLFGSKTNRQNFHDKTAINFKWAQEECSKKIVVKNTSKNKRQTNVDDRKVVITKEIQKVAVSSKPGSRYSTNAEPSSSQINSHKVPVTVKPGCSYSNMAEPSSSQMTCTTILPLTNEEFNKSALQCLQSIIKPDTDGKYTLHSHLYSTHENVKRLLEIELQNHKDSNTSSIAHLLIPQMCGNLQMDILKNIDSKTLSELHISLASSISYEFWKKCCKAYASQCIEKNMTLQAIPYLLCSHKYNESIDALCAGHFYLEAWIIAKLYKDIDDITYYNSIKTQWITYLESQGNLHGAALVAASVQDYATAIGMLSKGSDPCGEKKAIIEWIKDFIK